MTRNPDDDLQAKKLELSLREANLDIHKAMLAKAEKFEAGAEELFARISTVDMPDALALQGIIALSNMASAISAFTEASLMLEYEDAQVSHQRAHVDRDSELSERNAHMQQVAHQAMEDMARNLRSQGIDVSQMPGFPGFVIGQRDEEDGPNT